LNNERQHLKSKQYKERILNLEQMMLIKFKKDTKIIPKESAWFEFHDLEGRIIDLQSSALYRKDILGIKEIHQADKIKVL
jgi:palmitoyl-protein thioesterase